MDLLAGDMPEREEFFLQPRAKPCMDADTCVASAHGYNHHMHFYEGQAGCLTLHTHVSVYVSIYLCMCIELIYLALMLLDAYISGPDNLHSSKCEKSEASLKGTVSK